jgi:putative transport protein
MEWLQKLILEEGVAHTVLLFAVVIALGMALGKIKIFNITLGIAGVLFSGILVIHFGHMIGMEGVNKEILEFCREFGLILFVYTIGMQVGPGFFDSMKREGLPMNLLAVLIILSGVVITVCLYLWGNVPLPVALGLFSGATTNTPSLGAGGQATVQAAVEICKGGLTPICVETLQSVGVDSTSLQALTQKIAAPGAETLQLIKSVVKDKAETLSGQGYAVAYPFGILGIILAMALVRLFFKVKLEDEQKAFIKAREAAAPGLQALNIEIQNQSILGQSVQEILSRHQLHLVISRFKRAGNVQVGSQELVLEMGDILLAVGAEDQLQRFQELVGVVAKGDLRQAPNLKMRNIAVTHHAVLGKTIDQLNWYNIHGAVVTRVTRGEFRLLAEPNDVKLHLGDILRVVGDEAALDAVSKEAGNSEKQLAHPEVLPLFVGIGLGVLFGSIPFFIPGIPAPVKLGLAGGPLLVAIVLARLRKVGPLNFFLPLGPNLILREVGIVLFLACVGIKAGHSFFKVLFEGDGFYWMALGAAITLIPLLIAGFVGRAIMKLNYMSLCGVLSGSMTDPPALAFANTMTKSDAPSIAYAAVYPLTMLMRILSAQLLAIFLLL